MWIMGGGGLRGSIFAWIAAAVCLAFGLTEAGGPRTAAAQDAVQSAPELADPPSELRSGNRPFGRQPGFGRPREFQSTCEVGYLFLDGEYLSPPYEIRMATEAVTVNGREVTCRLVEPEHDRPWRRPEAITAQTLDEHLQMGGIVLAFPDQPLVAFPDPMGRREFFAHILGRQVVKPVSLVERLPPEFDRQVWDDWLKAYRAPTDLRERAEADLSVFEKAEADGEAAIAAARRLDQLSYPMTMFGMIATVLGFGHLLSHKPATGGQPLDKDASLDAVRVISWSLLLIVVFSALDLAWTILTYQAGQMREMNPFGSHLVESPQQLMMFKAGATLVTVGLLFGLRTYRRAQLAAWWACLILTLLTARWLTLNSMFIAV